MKPEHRARVQALTAPLAKLNATANSWRDRVRAELAEGPMTPIELTDVLARTRNDRQTLRNAVLVLRKRGELRLRPMIKPAGRAVRVAPVMVLELVEDRSAAA